MPHHRKKLPHETPSWVDDSAIFYITICANDRPTSPLTQSTTPTNLLDSALHYHQAGRWHLYLIVIMPDHIHFLASFPAEESMKEVITAWKRFTARAKGFTWQRDFFDHRLRTHESFDEKAHYIRMNPVRANLVTTPNDWPHIWQPPR